MRIFHLALAADWEAARATGRYTISTRGRTLREVGFIHASHADQWQRVRRDLYADVTEPLVLLTIDTDLLDAPVVEEAAPGSEETFPHVYGALDVAAVVQATPLKEAAPARPADASKTLWQLFVEEMAFRAALGFGVMVFAGVLGFTAQQLWGDGVAFPVTLVALAVGIAVAWRLTRRRDAAR